MAARTGTTPRTIRYYEEIGLLPGGGRAARPARTALYDEEDVERLEEVLRLKQLLGVSLDELRELVAAERARAALRAEWQRGRRAGAGRQREILEEALGPRRAPARARRPAAARRSRGSSASSRTSARGLRARLAELAGAAATR